MNLNLVSAILINLWLAGWILAGIWAALKTRAETRACPPVRDCRGPRPRRWITKHSRRIGT